MRYLKQSTSVDVGVGPFLDETDGKTAETALTITQPDIRLKKNGGAWAQKAAAQTLTHEEAGWYELTLDATDTDTIGHLLVAIHESGALPVWVEFHVLAANVYDSLFGAATDKLDVNVEEWNTTAVPAEHTAGYPIVTVKDGTGTGEINTASGVVQAQLADGLTHGGTTASLRLGSTGATPALYITNSGGDAAQIEATGSNGEGLHIVGHNTGSGLHVQGGANAHGLHAEGGSSTGQAVRLTNTLGDSLAIVGAASVSGTTTLNALTVTNATTLTGAVSLGSTLGVTGAITATNASNNLRLGTFTVDTNAIAWNASWDAEVQSEVQDAIEVNNLDHLVKIAVDTNFATTVHLDSVIGHLADGGTTATFDRTTDSLEALQAEHDATQTAINTVDDFLDTEIAAIKAKTDQLTFTTANRVDSQVYGMEAGVVTAASIATGAIDADALAADVVTDIFMGTALTEAYASDGAAATPAQLLYMIYSAVMEFSISGTTLTCKKLDGSTTAMTVTLNDATNPTSRTRSG